MDTTSFIQFSPHAWPRRKSGKIKIKDHFFEPCQPRRHRGELTECWKAIVVVDIEHKAHLLTLTSTVWSGTAQRSLTQLHKLHCVFKFGVRVQKLMYTVLVEKTLILLPDTNEDGLMTWVKKSVHKRVFPLRRSTVTDTYLDWCFMCTIRPNRVMTPFREDRFSYFFGHSSMLHYYTYRLHHYTNRSPRYGTNIHT